MLWVFFYWPRNQRVVNSGHPRDNREANINTSPQHWEGASLKRPHLLLGCVSVKHVEHFLWQSCFHTRRPCVHTVNMTLFGHTEHSHAQKKERERVFFVTLFQRKGERFNQSIIAFTKQNGSVSHFPGAKNVTSSCKIRMNGVSYFIRITSTELSLYCEGCWVATQRPNNVAAFGNHRCWGRSTKIILFIQGCWVPKSTHCKLWAFSPSCFSSADASILLT